MKALYLEPDEEITSVVDRLKEIEDEEVAIIVPRRAGILQSIINLKLLRYQAERLKKRISIVTTDRTGRNLASAVGLTVYQKLPDGTEVKESAVKEPEVVPTPVKFKRRQTIVGEDGEPQPKPPAKPVIETKPVAEPEPEAVDEEDDSAPADEATSDSEPADGPDSGDTETPVAPTGANGRPRRGLKLPKFRAPSKPRLTKAGRRIGKRGAVIAGIGALVLLAGSALAATFVFPTATVQVTAKTDPLNVDAPVTFSARQAAPDAGGNVMPAKVIEVTVDSTATVQATGSQSGGEAAKGAIVVVNEQSKNQSLVARTRFAAPNGKIYRIQERVVVPARGEVPATVVADEGGEEGNLPAGTRLTVPGLGGNTQIFGRVDTALTGGTSGGGAKVVSSGDIERAKVELGKRAAQDGLSQAKAKLAVGYQLNPEMAATTVLSGTANPAQGSVAETFTFSGPVKVSYFTYQDELLQQLVEDDIKAKLPAGTELVTDGTTRSFVVNQLSADRLIGTLKVNTFSARSVSREQFRQQLAGKSPAEAETALTQSGQASGVMIRLFPFWLGSLPSQADRIRIEFVSSPVTPSLTPTVAPTATPTVDPSQPPSI